MRSPDRPRVTVMVPVRNEARFIEGTLEQLYHQDYPRDALEVIVADGCSDDGTPAIVRGFAERHPDFDLKVLDNPKRLSSAARNLAVRHGRGEYFLLIDGHVHIPSTQLVSDAVDLAQRQGARVLGRPQPLNPPHTGPFQQAVALARQSPLAHSGESFIYSGYEGWCSPLSIGTMYHRSVFSEVGLFDEAFDAAEDVEFNYRAEQQGLRCYTSPKLAVHYYPRSDLRGLFRQLKRYGYGRARFLGKHPQRLTLETLVPPGFVLTLASLLLLAPFWLPAAVGLGGLLALYVGVLLGEGVRLNLRTGRRFLLQVPAIIATIHFGLGVGFLSGLPQLLSGLGRRQRTRDASLAR